jgi:hypothetical protein
LNPLARGHTLGAPDERAGIGRVELHYDDFTGLDLDLDVCVSRLIVIGRLGERFVSDREELDDDVSLLGIPAEGDGPDPELLDDRLVERASVTDPGWRYRRNCRVATATAQRLVEQQVEPLREHGNLLLLESDACDAWSVLGLEEECALSWLTHRSRDEPIRFLEIVDDHSHEESVRRR